LGKGRARKGSEKGGKRQEGFLGYLLKESDGAGVCSTDKKGFPKGFDGYWYCKGKKKPVPGRGIGTKRKE